MNRSQLIRAFQAHSGVTAREADWFVRQVFEILTEGLRAEGRVELRGFGVFRLRPRRQAGFTNPKDGRYYGGMTLNTVKFYPSDSSGNE